MLNKIKEKYTPSRLYYDISYGKIDRSLIDSKTTIIGKIIESVNIFLNSCIETDLPGVCCQMAFIILFALLPTLLFIILICTRFIPDFDTTFLQFIETLIPQQSYDYIASEIELLLGYVNRLKYFIIIMSALMGTLSAHTILIGINQTYGFAPYSSKRWEWFKSFILLIVLSMIIAAVTLSLIWAGIAAHRVILETGAYSAEEEVSYGFMGTAAILGIFVILLGIYTFTPQRRIMFRDSWPGTLFATVGILFIFQIYVKILNRSANYLIIYGTLSGLFILLTALYFLSWMITIGAKINTFFAHRKIKK